MFRHDWRGAMPRMADTGAGAGAMPDSSGNGDAQLPDGATPEGQRADPPSFETWYAGQDEQIKGLIDARMTNLQSALATERTNRTNLTKQIKDLAAKAEKGSELEKQLSEASQKLEQAERRAEFMADAIRPEIGCSNAKAAYALAVTDDLFDRHGKPDWNTLKQLAPELFRKPSAGSADGGAGTNQPPKLDMNTLIRRAAGRG